MASLRQTFQLLSITTLHGNMSLWCFLLSFLLLTHPASAQLGEPTEGLNDELTLPYYDTTRASFTIGKECFKLKGRSIETDFLSYLNTDDDNLKLEQEYLTQAQQLLQVARSGQPVKPLYPTLQKLAQHPNATQGFKSIEAAVQAVHAARLTIAQRKITVEGYQEALALLERKLDIEKHKRTFNQKTVNGKKVSPQKTIKHLYLEKQERELKRKIKDLTKFGNEGLKNAQSLFAAVLANLYYQQYFEHVEIGSKLYSELFTNSHQPIVLTKESELLEHFAHLDKNKFTVPQLGRMAKKMSTLLLAYTQLAETHYKQGELFLGVNRLLDTYILGKNTIYIKTVPSKLRNPFYPFSKQANQLSQLLRLRQLTKAEKIADTLANESKYFPTQKIKGHFTAFKTASDHHIDQALLAIKNNNKNDTHQQLAHARILWPTNPRLAQVKQMLESEMTHLIESSHSYQNAVSKFDQLKRSQDYYPILEPELFSHFTKQFNNNNDQNRLDQLMLLKFEWQPLLERIQALKLLSAEKPYLAWENALDLQAEFPTDKKIKQLLSSITINVAPLPDLIEKANAFIKDQQYGPALSKVIKAQRLFPASRLAQKQLDIILEQLDKE